MALPQELSDKQHAVLEWIRAGRPSGVYDDDGYMHRISARALERRGLVTVAGSGDDWVANLTEAGRAWQLGSAMPVAQASPRRASTTAPVSALTQRRLAAEELIDQVMSLGGRLQWPKERPAGELENLVRESMRASNRPHGKRLVLVRVGGWEGPLEVQFEDHLDDLVAVEPVPVPERVGKYSPAVRAYLDEKDWHYVSREHLQRAARILEALAREAPKRGMTIKAAGQATSAQPRRSDHLAIAVDDTVYWVQIREVSQRGGAPVNRPPWNARSNSPAWTHQRMKEFIPSGKLELIVRGRFMYDGDRYADTKTITVEERLPSLFRTLQIYRLRANAQEEERLRREAERQRQWAAAMTLAKERYYAAARREHILGLAKEWREVGEQRALIEAARAALTEYAGDDREAIGAALDEAARAADAADPISNLASIVPTVAVPRQDDLRPFLDGWSPWGPNSH
jgi:hypothetical protein